MTYDEFRRAWSHALRDSSLPNASAHEGKETMDLRSMDRTFESRVEPVGGQDAEPFYVTATLSWRWDSLLTARTATTEEDMLSELLGREQARGVETEPSWMRVDVTLHATLPYGKPIPMPAPAAWGQWVREVRGRIEEIEPLTPGEHVRSGRERRPEVLAWQEEPVAKMICAPGGELRLASVEIAAWQILEVPRRWDDSDREPDEHPARPLHEMFERVGASLHAWMQAVDHLAPRTRR